MRENANLRVVSQDFSPMFNGFDTGDQPDDNNNEDGAYSNQRHLDDARDGSIPRSPSLRSSGTRPTSMIEMRDPNRQQLMQGVSCASFFQFLKVKK